jgi:hypothetical protein
MQAITVSTSLAAADADGICQSQQPSAGGVQSLTINGALATGGVANLGSQRRVLISSTGNDSTNTFVITGANWCGSVISESITGPASPATVYSVLDYETVTSVTISGNAVGNITVGTNGVGGSPWIRMDDFAPSNISIQCNVASGSVNYTVQSTLDDPNDPFFPVAPDDMTWINSSDLAVVAANSSQQSNFLFTPKYARVLINSGTGTLRSTFLQSSNGPE